MNIFCHGDTEARRRAFCQSYKVTKQFATKANLFTVFSLSLCPCGLTAFFSLCKNLTCFQQHFSVKIKPPLSFLSGDACKVCDVGEQAGYLCQQGQSVGLNLFIIGHNHDPVEEGIDRFA